MADNIEVAQEIVHEIQPAPNAGNYIFSVADLEGDDWAVYHEPKAVVEVAAEEEKAAEAA